MKIFISWSGPQAQSIAELLRGWLNTVLVGRVTAWVSSQDISKGDRAMSAIAKELEAGSFGIVVVTRANAEAPWINFEAGALGKSLGESRVATVLLDVTPADIAGPLAQFQATALSDRNDVLKLVKDVSAAVEDGVPMPEEALEVLFDQKWPELDAAVKAATGGSTPVTERSEKEILEELLDLVRGLVRGGAVLTEGWGTSPDAFNPSRATILLGKAAYRAARDERMEEFARIHKGDYAMQEDRVIGRIVDWDTTPDGEVVVFVVPDEDDDPHAYIKLPLRKIKVV